jgi:hypothetical protein
VFDILAHYIIVIASTIAAMGAAVAAWQFWLLGQKVTLYRLEINSRMTEFIEVIKKASFAEGRDSTSGVDPHVILAKAEAAAKVLDEAATRAAVLLAKPKE